MNSYRRILQTVQNRFEDKKNLKNNWPLFLESIRIDGLRDWNGQLITFQFPVVALAGENGSGKSTVLHVAACAYPRYNRASADSPDVFFPTTQWDSVENVTLTFDVRQGDQIIEFIINKKDKDDKWIYSQKRPTRPVTVLDIFRITPFTTFSRKQRIYARFEKIQVQKSSLEKEYIDYLSYVLGYKYNEAAFVTSDNLANVQTPLTSINTNQAKEFSLLKSEIGEFSQLHQGSGEGATHDLFRTLQSIPEKSLVIIDEIEACLHPKAQRRLVQFLLWLSKQKKVQIILSTHSPYVLQELPPEGRILLLRGSSGVTAMSKITPEFAMGYIDEDLSPELYLFCEDEEAHLLVRKIILSHEKGTDIIRRVSIKPVGSANDVRTLGKLMFENKLPYKGYGVLDGDQDDKDGCITLPAANKGEEVPVDKKERAPERVVFNGLKSKKWCGLPQKFRIKADILLPCLEDAMREQDHHLWIEKVRSGINEVSTKNVWEVLVDQWCQLCLSAKDRNRIVKEIEKLLKK